MTTAVANISNLRGALSSYKRTAPRVRGGAGFLNYSKGDWTYGRNKATLPTDCVWVLHPQSIQHGFICWRDGRIFHEELKPFSQELTDEHALPEPPAPKPGSDDQDGYSYQLGATLACIEGELEGEQMTFKSSTVGGVGELQKLLDELEARLDEIEATGDTRAFPVIKLDSDHYMHKTRGKIFVPVVELVGWSSGDPADEIDWIDEDAEAEAPEVAPEPEPAKVTRRRRTA